MSALGEIFEEKVRAGVPGILIRSAEHEEAITELREICRRPDNRWALAIYDMDQGVRVDRQVNGKWKTTPQYYTAKEEADNSLLTQWKYSIMKSLTPGSKEALKPVMDPVDAIRALPGMSKDIAALFTPLAPLPGAGAVTPANPIVEKKDVRAILVMKNHHRWLTTPTLTQVLANQLWFNKQHGLIIVLLAPTTELPVELKRLFEAGHIRHQLPDRKQIRKVMLGVATEDHFPKDEAVVDRLIDAAAGLTRLGVEDATALSLARYGRLQSDMIFDLKAEAFNTDSQALRIYRGQLTLADYGGAEYLKQYCLGLLKNRSTNPKYRPKGIFMVGPPGSGKTHLSRCLGSSVDRAIAEVTLGALKSRFQGASFENMLQLLETLDAMSPLIAMFDEIEGQVAGGKDTGSMDAGTQSQLNSKLLGWLSERTSDVFVLAAANSVRSLMRDMPEFARLGRFDGLFFLDYPGRVAKDAIWDIHLKGYELIDPDKDVPQQISDMGGLPDDKEWTGSEIEACCRLARLLGKKVHEIGAFMPTIAKQATATIEEIRDWAHGRCYSSEYEGIYNKNEHEGRLEALGTKEQGRRRVTAKPSKIHKGTNGSATSQVGDPNMN